MSPTTGFTLAHYRELLCETRSKYPCVGFEVLDEPSLPDRFAIIRHDIDISPACSLELARIESDLGVRATYTVLLTGDSYSPFEGRTRLILREIASLGHDIGLHFDAAWHGIDSEAALQEAIRWESETLNRVLGLIQPEHVKMFSFHNTTPFTMACLQSHYAGLRNAYAGVLQSGVSYTSDSNGYWIHRSWNQLLSEGHDRIQVLTHPEWWRWEEGEPAEKVCAELLGRGRACWIGYRRLLEEGGRDNRTGLSLANRLLPVLYKEDGEQLLMLWLDGRHREAYLELYGRFDRQARRLARSHLQSVLRARPNQIDAVFRDATLQLDPLRCLLAVTNSTVRDLVGLKDAQYEKLGRHRDSVVHGYTSFRKAELAESFDRLSAAISSLDAWAAQHPIGPLRGAEAGAQRLAAEGVSFSDWLRRNQSHLRLRDDALRQFLSRHEKLFADSATVTRP